jgi:broad specificity phosphatase PhoE
LGCTSTLLIDKAASHGLTAQQCYYSVLDGADGITWSDAHLTGLGQDQAKNVHDLWRKLLAKGIPPPERYYVSPLTRTIETADLSFKELALGDDRSYKPQIKEVRVRVGEGGSQRLTIGAVVERSAWCAHLRSPFDRFSPR